MDIDWGDAAAWAAFVIAAVSAFFAWRSVREAKKSREAAERSADAGEVSAQAAVRSADAAEKSHQLAERQYQESLPAPVEWVIQQVGKSKFQLMNVGTDTATGVTINPDSVPIGRQFPQNETVGGDGGYVEFLLFGSAQQRIPNELEVTWDGAPAPAVVPIRKF